MVAEEGTRDSKINTVIEAVVRKDQWFCTEERWFLKKRFPIQSLTEYSDKRFQGMFDKRNSVHLNFIYDSRLSLSGKFVMPKAVRGNIG